MVGTILWAIIGGAVVGILARLFMPGRQNISMLMTVIIGIAAALVGGVLATWLGVGDTSGIDWIRHAIQIVLAILAIWGYLRLTGRGSVQRR